MANFIISGVIICGNRSVCLSKYTSNLNLVLVK